jgi:hypothetical protein
MQRVGDSDLDSFRRERSGEAHSYRLTAGSGLVATLHWSNALGTLATAEGEGFKWTIKRTGFLSPRVSVREASTGRERAVLHIHLHTNLLQVPGGGSYRWLRTGFWVPAWEFQDASGRELLDIEPVREESQLKGGLVEVAAEGKTNPELLLLLVVGWYFIVQSWIEDEAVAASRAILDATSG